MTRDVQLLTTYTPLKFHIDTKNDALENVSGASFFGVILGINSSNFRRNSFPDYLFRHLNRVLGIHPAPLEMVLKPCK